MLLKFCGPVNSFFLSNFGGGPAPLVPWQSAAQTSQVSPSSTSNNIPAIFDDENLTKEAADFYEKKDLEELDKRIAYIQATKPRVVNISMGTTYKDCEKEMESLWRNYLKSRGINENKKRTPKQEKNFRTLVDRRFEDISGHWGYLFNVNPKVLFVLAAGNSGKENDFEAGDITLEKNKNTPPNWAASFKNVITVANCDENGKLYKTSSYGMGTIHIAAIGVNVRSTAPNSNYTVMSGTSMAAPQVSGVAAKMLAINPQLSPVEVIKIILDTAEQSFYLSELVSSRGMLDAEAAIEAAKKN